MTNVTLRIARRILEDTEDRQDRHGDGCSAALKFMGDWLTR